MDIAAKLAEELSIKKTQADAAIKLIDEGNTIPFIARYRKEVTGALNDEVLRNLNERLLYLRNLEDRKQTVLASIEEQGKLTADLKKQIEAAQTLVAVEDLYLPYRPKRRTRATIAKERGLEPLAQLLWEQNLTGTLEEAAAPFVDAEKEVPNAAAALAGASDIIAEQIADDAAIRSRVRQMTAHSGRIISVAKEPKQESVYEMYYDFDEPVEKLPGHRTLAINRGEKEKILSVHIEAPEEEILSWMIRQAIKNENAPTAAFLSDVVKDSYQRLIAPSIERELRSSLTEEAEDGAIRVFGKNLQQLLLQPPITGQVVLGWDPAFRTGCKLAVVDPTGKVLDTTVIFPTAPQNRVEEAKKVLKHWIQKYNITLISLGNGTASRESEAVICELLHEIPTHVSYVIVNEAGASVYSASKLATEEFPNFDVGQRSAASIARRLQDPLAELVKIEPRAIGVGQYQHDMNQKKLGESLSGVVEDVVNRVGVNLNTASASLLEYVSGISKPIAKNIVAYREENGAFKKRAELLKVPKLGPKAYEQCAGFLRIREGAEPLDATSVHPESYAATRTLLSQLGHDPAEVAAGGLKKIKSEVTDVEKTANELGIGALTLSDILDELEKPGRDPRSEMPAPILRQDILEMKDLQPGMILKGTVRNVIDFGVFVDIGVHQDGLVHISRICDRFIKHPLEAVSVGDIVDVQVLEVDLQKKRIALTMRIGQEDKAPGTKGATGAERPKREEGKNGQTRGNRPHEGRRPSGNERANGANPSGGANRGGPKGKGNAGREQGENRPQNRRENQHRGGAMWDALQKVKGQLPKE